MLPAVKKTVKQIYSLSEKFRRVGEGTAFAYPSINPSMDYSDRLEDRLTFKVRKIFHKPGHLAVQPTCKV
jgi:hypothetical protein